MRSSVACALSLSRMRKNSIVNIMSYRNGCYLPRRAERRSASLGGGGSLRVWASFANRSALRRAVFSRMARASASYSIIAFRPSCARSSCLKRRSACCRACSEFTMNLSCAATLPQMRVAVIVECVSNIYALIKRKKAPLKAGLSGRALKVGEPPWRPPFFGWG
jgi:hypothetical protein